jgi:hypothetical protein
MKPPSPPLSNVGLEALREETDQLVHLWQTAAPSVLGRTAVLDSLVLVLFTGIIGEQFLLTALKRIKWQIGNLS